MPRKSLLFLSPILEKKHPASDVLMDMYDTDAQVFKYKGTDLKIIEDPE
jgi:hypothetical protein